MQYILINLLKYLIEYIKYIVNGDLIQNIEVYSCNEMGILVVSLKYM